MTDQELLELSAKAGGYQYMPANGCIVVDGIPGRWNPLTDDGDALRLAVAVEAEIVPNCSAKNGVYVYVDHPNVFRELYVNHGGDKFAATRRAIVRAAAEIGRCMSVTQAERDAQ